MKLMTPSNGATSSNCNPATNVNVKISYSGCSWQQTDHLSDHEQKGWPLYIFSVRQPFGSSSPCDDDDDDDNDGDDDDDGIDDDDDNDDDDDGNGHDDGSDDDDDDGNDENDNDSTL